MDALRIDGKFLNQNTPSEFFIQSNPNFKNNKSEFSRDIISNIKNEYLETTIKQENQKDEKNLYTNTEGRIDSISSDETLEICKDQNGNIVVLIGNNRKNSSEENSNPYVNSNENSKYEKGNKNDTSSEVISQLIDISKSNKTTYQSQIPSNSLSSNSNFESYDGKGRLSTTRHPFKNNKNSEPISNFNENSNFTKRYNNTSNKSKRKSE